MPGAARTIALPRSLRGLDATKMYALSGFTTLDRYATANGGGEAGSLATGFAIFTLAQLRSLPSTSQIFSARSGGSAEGYFNNVNSSNQLVFQVKGTSTFLASPTYPFVASDVGKIFLFGGLVSTAGLVRLFVARAERGVGTAQTGYVAPAGTIPASLVGLANAVQPAVGLAIFAEAALRGVPSDAQVIALYDAVRALGDFPASAVAEALMPGTTITHRWSLRDTLTARKYDAADNSIAPAGIADSVTLAAVDQMARTGLPVVRRIDPSTNGRMTYGAQGFAVGVALQSALGAGFLGSAAGFTIRLAVTFWSIASSTGYIAVAWNGASTRGWAINRNVTTLGFYVRGVLVSKALTAADVGMPHLLHVVYNGSAMEAFYDGVSIGSAAAPSYLAENSPALMALGAINTTASFPANESVWSFAGANYIASAADVAADFAAWQRTARLSDIPSKPDANRYEISTDIIANGGPSAGIPATVLDRVGTSHLTRLGTGLQVAQRAERLWSYETSPILYGAGTFTQTDYYETATNLGDSNTQSFWAAVFFLVFSQSVTSKPRDLFGSINSTSTQGFAIRSNTSNNSINFLAMDNTAAARTPTTAGISATDVGKLQVYLGVWDQPATKVRGYFKRVESGTGTTVTGYGPSAGGMRIGRNFQATDRAADGLVVYGVAAGLGVPTLAQIQAFYDDTLANERIGSISGLTTLRVDLDADARANSNTLPATLTDRASGTFGFARTGAMPTTSQYARAFGW
jgi:hypothetical protein